MKRKHRIVVDVTFDRPLTNRKARGAVGLILTDADKAKSLSHWDVDINKFDVKHFDNILASEKARLHREVKEHAAARRQKLTERENYIDGIMGFGK